MLDDSVTRRGVLRCLAAGGATAMGAGTAAGGEGPTPRIVGTDSPRAERAARRRADSVKRVLDFGSIGKAVAGRFTDRAARELANRPDVRYVEKDGEMKALEQTLPWGIDRIDADIAHGDGFTGNGADIAIIDTGIDSDHVDLEGNLGAGKCFASDCCGEAGGLFCSPNDNTCHEAWDDDNDHGTHVAGTADAVNNSEDVVGVSTEATLHAAKVLDGCGSGSYSDVAAGIEWVADQGYDVGNMSLGGDKSSTVEDAVEYAYNNGVLLVAAAGNDGPCSDCVSYPAAEPEVIAVSATTKDDSLADFSSTGPEVELAAPGKDVLSTVPPESSSDGTDTFSGTSMASPHVAGTGGLVMAEGQSNTEARSTLQDTAEDIGLGDNEQGYGLVDAEAAANATDSGSNSAPSVDSLSVSEVETDDSDAEFDVSWQVSDTDGNLSSVDLTLTDDTDGETEDTASISVSGDSASGTTRLVAAGDDGSGNSYTVELVVTDSDGATDSDTTSVTETEDTSDSAPAIDQFDLIDDSNPAWTRYYVDWAVSDDDGDLADVVSEMVDASGNVLDSESSSVSGSSASGTHYLRTKQSASEIVLTVTDGAGNTTSDSKSI